MKFIFLSLSVLFSSFLYTPTIPTENNLNQEITITSLSEKHIPDSKDAQPLEEVASGDQIVKVTVRYFSSESATYTISTGGSRLSRTISGNSTATHYFCVSGRSSQAVFVTGTANGTTSPTFRFSSNLKVITNGSCSSAIGTTSNCGYDAVDLRPRGGKTTSGKMLLSCLSRGNRGSSS